MGKGLPSKAAVGVPGRTVSIDPDTYFIAKRMERVGMLRPGHALMLAATLKQASAKRSGAKRGKGK